MSATTASTAASNAKKMAWLPIAIFSAAQFVMILDSSVMNVSITEIVKDLNTTIAGVQLAITAYTLVMAAFMLVGAKLGDIFGREKIFAIGLCVYGLGSLTTSLSPNLTVLLIGWSLIEGFGAAMVMPAIVSQIAATYEGKQRALAFGIIGGITGVAIAAGPLIGGFITTEFSWRYVFAGETVIVIIILIVRHWLKKAPRSEHKPRFDGFGVLLSSLGLALAVYGILKSSDWGWIKPRGALTIDGTKIEPFGLSVVPFFILAGLGLLAAFWIWEERRARQGKDGLVDLTMLKIPTMRAGLTTLMMQQLILLGTFFVLPVFLQVVVGLNAFETGVRIFPLSIAILLAAMAGPKLAAHISPRRISQIGLLLLSAASLVLLGTIDVELNDLPFSIALGLFGIGAGLLFSQLGNVIISSVGEDRSNEAGGLQGTAQNLGASLGTALIGSVLIAALSTGVATKVEQNPDVPAAAQQQIVQTANSTGVQILPVSEVQSELEAAGLTQAQAESLAQDYSDAEVQGLKIAMFVVTIIAILSLWFTRRLPKDPLKPDAPAETTAA